MIVLSVVVVLVVVDRDEFDDGTANADVLKDVNAGGACDMRLFVGRGTLEDGPVGFFVGGIKVVVELELVELFGAAFDDEADDCDGLGAADVDGVIVKM